MVNASQRKNGELIVLNDAQKLFDYTYQITRNNFNKTEDNFQYSQDYKWFCDEIRRICLYAVLDIRTANKKKISDLEERKERLTLQNGVEIMYERLSGIVKIAYENQMIKNKKIKTWDKLIDDALISLRKWRKSDKERY